MSADTRLKLGVALLILGLVMPAGTLLVAAADWPIAVKTVVSSILLFGFEIMLVPAVALMGKDNFERIWAGAMRLLKTLKPAGNVGKTRYKVGLYLLVGPSLGSRATLPPGYRRTTSCGFGSIWDSTSSPSRACLCWAEISGTKCGRCFFMTPVSCLLPERPHSDLATSSASRGDALCIKIAPARSTCTAVSLLARSGCQHVGALSALGAKADIDRAALTESGFYEYTPLDAVASLTGGER